MLLQGEEVVDSAMIMHSARPVRKKRGTHREGTALTHECCTAPHRQVGTCTHTYIHTYIHACMHAYIHTYIHVRYSLWPAFSNGLRYHDSAFEQRLLCVLNHGFTTPKSLHVSHDAHFTAKSGCAQTCLFSIWCVQEQVQLPCSDTTVPHASSAKKRLLQDE